jgi:hypothetical protein
MSEFDDEDLAVDETRRDVGQHFLVGAERSTARQIAIGADRQEAELVTFLGAHGSSLHGRENYHAWLTAPVRTLVKFQRFTSHVGSTGCRAVAIVTGAVEG